jgi:hypothetical protein
MRAQSQEYVVEDMKVMLDENVEAIWITREEKCAA